MNSDRLSHLATPSTSVPNRTDIPVEAIPLRNLLDGEEKLTGRRMMFGPGQYDARKQECITRLDKVWLSHSPRAVGDILVTVWISVFRQSVRPRLIEETRSYHGSFAQKYCEHPAAILLLRLICSE